MSGLPDTLAKILSEYLIRNGLTVQEIADAAGVTRAAVHNWLNGADARNGNLLQLVTFYGLNKISFNDLALLTVVF